jgi:hypothetical protein
MIPELEDTVSMSSWQVVLDQVDVAFDDEHAVVGAGLLLAAGLAGATAVRRARGWPRMAGPAADPAWTTRLTTRYRMAAYVCGRCQSRWSMVPEPRSGCRLGGSTDRIVTML